MEDHSSLPTRKPTVSPHSGFANTLSGVAEPSIRSGSGPASSGKDKNKPTDSQRTGEGRGSRSDGAGLSRGFKGYWLPAGPYLNLIGLREGLVQGLTEGQLVLAAVELDTDGRSIDRGDAVGSRWHPVAVAHLQQDRSRRGRLTKTEGVPRQGRCRSCRGSVCHDGGWGEGWLRARGGSRRPGPRWRSRGGSGAGRRGSLRWAGCRRSGGSWNAGHGWGGRRRGAGILGYQTLTRRRCSAVRIHHAGKQIEVASVAVAACRSALGSRALILPDAAVTAKLTAVADAVGENAAATRFARPLPTRRRAGIPVERAAPASARGRSSDAGASRAITREPVEFAPIADRLPQDAGPYRARAGSKTVGVGFAALSVAGTGGAQEPRQLRPRRYRQKNKCSQQKYGKPHQMSSQHACPVSVPEEVSAGANPNSAPLSQSKMVPPILRSGEIEGCALSRRGVRRSVDFGKHLREGPRFRTALLVKAPGGDSWMSEYSAWLECINGCPTRFSVFEVVYRCPDCGDLLDVRHDVAALRRRSPAAWMQLFDERYRRSDFPYGSGVWGKKEWVLPFLANENVVSTYEGGTNLLWAERYGRMLGVEDLWVKQCGNSHTGSFKDLGMTVLVSAVKQMIAEGQNIAAIACASTGDTSAALANYCAAAGIPAVVLLPKNKVSPAQLVQPIANGALVLSLDTDFDGCMALVQEITKEKTVYLANSMNSLRLEGQKTVGIELVQQFNWEVPDWIIIPGGNLGNVSALGKGLTLMKELGLIRKLPRLVVAQAENANPLYLAYQSQFAHFTPVQAKKTLASAIQIGNPVSYRRAVQALQAFEGIVEQASESELADEAALADRTGMFNCPHTGVALAAFRKLVERKVIHSQDRVVIISTAHGLKFAEQKTAYHLGQIPGIQSRYANRPVEVEAKLGKVVDAIRRFADRVKLLEA